jgi:hypothetical protein
MLYCLYAIEEKFPVQAMPGHRNTPPPPMGAGLALGGQSSLEKRISHENWPFQELLMGVETPIPPKMITTAAPDGAPPRRIKTVEKKYLQIFTAWV